MWDIFAASFSVKMKGRPRNEALFAVLNFEYYETTVSEEL